MLISLSLYSSIYIDSGRNTNRTTVFILHIANTPHHHAIYSTGTAVVGWITGIRYREKWTICLETILTSWHETLSAWLSLCVGNPPITSQSTSNTELWSFFVICHRKLLNEQSIWPSFETPEHQYNLFQRNFLKYHCHYVIKKCFGPLQFAIVTLLVVCCCGIAIDVTLFLAVKTPEAWSKWMTQITHQSRMFRSEYSEQTRQFPWQLSPWPLASSEHQQP